MQEHACNIKNLCLKQEAAASLVSREQMNCVEVDAIPFGAIAQPVLLNHRRIKQMGVRQLFTRSAFTSQQAD